MRILLDESLPRRLRLFLTGHEVQTVQEMGWSGSTNGELMNLAQESFDAFITADQNLEYQQNLAIARISILVLAAPTNRIEDLIPLMTELTDVLENIKPGEIVRLSR